MPGRAGHMYGGAQACTCAQGNLCRFVEPAVLLPPKKEGRSCAVPMSGTQSNASVKLPRIVRRERLTGAREKMPAWIARPANGFRTWPALNRAILARTHPRPSEWCIEHLDVLYYMLAEPGRHGSRRDCRVAARTRGSLPGTPCRLPSKTRYARDRRRL